MNKEDKIESQVKELLDFIKSDYPKSNSQEEHEHNIKIVEYAVNQCKYGLKEKLRESLSQAEQRGRKEGYETGFAQAEVKQGLPRPLHQEIRKDTAREIVEMLEEKQKIATKRKKEIENDPFHPVRSQYLGQEDALNVARYLIKQKYKLED